LKPCLLPSWRRVTLCIGDDPATRFVAAHFWHEANIVTILINVREAFLQRTDEVIE
jgi:hypothetical protein